MEFVINILNRKKIIVFMILIFVYPSLIFANDKTLELATLEWPPYVGKQVKDNGFTAKITKEAFKRVGLNVRIYFMPWAKVLKDVERGKYDAAFPAYYSKQRDAIYGLSNMIAKGPLVFLKRKDSIITYSKLEDLKNYKIGIVRGYVNTEEFDNVDYLNKIIGNSDEQNLRKVLKKRIDLAVIDKYTAINILNIKLSKEKENIDFLGTPLDEKGLYVAFSKKKPDYKKKLLDFNKGLEMLIKDGTIKKIMKNYGF